MIQSVFYLPKRVKTFMWLISDVCRRVSNLLDGSGITHINVLTRLGRSNKVDPPGWSSNDKSDSVIFFSDTQKVYYNGIISAVRLISILQCIIPASSADFLRIHAVTPILYVYIKKNDLETLRHVQQCLSS